MPNSAPSAASDFNTKIIEEFRANEGRVGGPLAGTPMILIHHAGAKSAIERVTPLAYSPQPGGRLAIVAANGGSPHHPDWYYNRGCERKESTPISRPDRRFAFRLRLRSVVPGGR